MIDLKIKDNLTLINAVRKYGNDNQISVAQEEFAELVVALSHDRRGRDSNVAEEMADARIMLEQLQIIYDNGIEVQDWIDRKMERLKERTGGG